MIIIMSLCVVVTFWMYLMFKNIAFIVLAVSANFASAKEVILHNAPLSSISHYSLLSTAHKMLSSPTPPPQTNSLQQLNKTQEDTEVITRYQQLFKGIPVVGAQIMISQDAKIAGSEVNGKLIEDLQINIIPKLGPQDAMALAKKTYTNHNPLSAVHQESALLQIRLNDKGEPQLVFLVSFKGVQEQDKPVWPFFVIDAESGDVITQWNNIKTYADTGAGGNEKVKEYWYGKDGLPALDVTQQGNQCIMDNAKVKLVNLGTQWDWSNSMLTAFQYLCDNNQEENINGAFSPSNDAYFFGHVIVDMYKKWYSVNALQHANGSPMKLVMRVHFGQNYDNAFWDGQAMSFGDGNDFYPLVSLDVAGHEVTHGFTEQHSGLEYHDESGALNESLSDMAGITAKAYLLETSLQLYNKAHLQANVVDWGIGETITRDSFGKALRFMDFPSSDGSSADCFDKNLARSSGSYCAISYKEVVAFANTNIWNQQERQNYIVHTASGVFNKAFYLLSQKFGIKDAYQLMIVANTKYWTPTTNFKKGACGVVDAAIDLNKDSQWVASVFRQVGIDTSDCTKTVF